MNFSRRFTFYMTAAALGLSLFVSGCSGETSKGQDGQKADTSSATQSETSR